MEDGSSSMSYLCPEQDAAAPCGYLGFQGNERRRAEHDAGERGMPGRGERN